MICSIGRHSAVVPRNKFRTRDTSSSLSTPAFGRTVAGRERYSCGSVMPRSLYLADIDSTYSREKTPPIVD